MSKRTDTLKQTLKNKILRRESGFIEGTPSIRELVASLNESRHVVAAALKELEDENFLICTPQKGFKVNPAVRLSAPQTPVQTLPETNVVFTEALSWQIDFWCAMVKKFEKKYPQSKIRPHFITDIDEIENFIAKHRTQAVIIVRAPSELFKKGIPFLPLPEIERNCENGFRRGDIIPELQNARLANSMPYLLQPPMLFYTRLPQQTPPDVSSWYALMQWVRRSYGSRSVMPINTSLMFRSLGIITLKKQETECLEKKLAELVKILCFIRKYDLYNVDLVSDDRFDQARRQLVEKSGAAVRNSFYFGALSRKEKPDDLQFSSLPLAEDGSLEIPDCRICMTAPECTPSAAEFFGFILSEEVQYAMIRECHGLSPYESMIQKVVDSPEEFHPGLGLVAKQILVLSKGRILCENKTYAGIEDFITQLLTDSLVLPILSAEPEKNELDGTIDSLIRQIQDHYDGIHKKQYMKSLRDQLLH